MSPLPVTVVPDILTMFCASIKWAGVCMALLELRAKLQLDAINTYAHSFSTNFHKWGLVAFDATALWVRDRELLTSALDVTPAYLRTAQGDAGESFRARQAILIIDSSYPLLQAQ